MPTQRFARIVVATDGSDQGRDAVRVAIDIALRFESELLVIAVAPIVPVIASPNGPMLPPGIPDENVPRYRSLVEEAVVEAQKAGLDHVTGVCEEGVVVDEILTRLTEEPADLLVVGSRGLSTAARIVLGSVSTALVHRAPCPVLVVRPRPTTTPPAP